MRLGLIIPHKTKVAIALWRRNTKNVPYTIPCWGLLIIHIYLILINDIITR